MYTTVPVLSTIKAGAILQILLTSFCWAGKGTSMKGGLEAWPPPPRKIDTFRGWIWTYFRYSCNFCLDKQKSLGNNGTLAVAASSWLWAKSSPATNTYSRRDSYIPFHWLTSSYSLTCLLPLCLRLGLANQILAHSIMLMNVTRSLWTATVKRSVGLMYPSCVKSHFKTHLNLFVLTSFEVTTMDSAVTIATCWLFNVRFGGAKFDRGWD